MLTLDKLRVYEEFGGDIDGWARSAAREKSSAMTDADWHLIDELLSGLCIVASGDASSSFKEGIDRRMQAAVADDGARKELLRLARRPK